MWCCHAAGVLTETTAELAASLTFAAARRVVEADRYMRKGLYLGWAPTLMVGQLLQVRHLPALLTRTCAPSCSRRGSCLPCLQARVVRLHWEALLTTETAGEQDSAASYVMVQTVVQVLKHGVPGVKACAVGWGAP